MFFLNILELLESRLIRRIDYHPSYFYFWLFEFKMPEWIPLCQNTVTATTTLVVLLLCHVVISTKYKTNVKSINYLEMLFSSMYAWFQRDVISTLTFKKQKYFVFFYVLFMFLITVNLAGLIPFSKTLTIFIVINLYFSTTTQLGTTLIGVYFNRFNFIKLLLPSNIPVVIAILLVPTEILSYISRTFSLAIRLFANMFAGHAVLKIVGAFLWTAAHSLNYIHPLVGIPFVVYFLILCLEVLVAVLQAYVFVSLSLIYINLTLNPH